MLEASLKTRNVFAFDKPLIDIKGIGPHAQKCLAKMNLHTFRDALFHFPLRYEDRTRLTPIKDMRAISKVMVQGQVQKLQIHRARRKWLSIDIIDGTGRVSLILFHFSQKQVDVLNKKPIIRCYGECKLQQGHMTLVHPEMQFISDLESPLEENWTPVYPTTKGLVQGVLRKVMSAVLEVFFAMPNEETLPSSILSYYQLMPFAKALKTIHYPSPDINPLTLEQRAHPAFKRLIVEELIAHQAIQKVTKALSQKFQAYPLTAVHTLLSRFVSRLPFDLTRAQKKSIIEIEADLKQQKPMMRLIQGDVGSGKTVVAAIAALHALAHNTQVALLAPTEILAQQHYQQFKIWFEPLGIPVIFLKGQLKVKEKRETLEKVKSQSQAIVIGTHALFQEAVIFNRLSLMIIDEQHRFGVHQRLQLRDKGGEKMPHQLVMTATPIPRTLAMTRYQNLDLTVIDELPPGRKPVATLCVNQDNRAEIIQRISEVIQKGQQIYWVCPLIEESEKLEIQAAQETFEELKNHLRFPVACIHGRMKVAEKAQVMEKFIENETKVLVATTVIEVGVNVPNATLMVIENAERLGLAQLHQLRGRVGRGASQSFCVLLYKRPLSVHAKRRLEVMRKTNDGFLIAEEDLRIRGPGEVLGVRQTGLQMFRVADIFRDQDLIHNLHEILENITVDYKDLASSLGVKWIGEKTEYQNV